MQFLFMIIQLKKYLKRNNLNYLLKFIGYVFRIITVQYCKITPPFVTDLLMYIFLT